MTSFLREEWQDPNLPVTGPPPQARRTVGVIHYSGSDNIPADKAAWLRSMQADYENNRGYSLGYGYLVCGNGDDWEIRGWHFNNAANNGDKVSGNANDWTLSILLDVTTESTATPAAIATCKRIFAAHEIFGRPVPHSHYDYTSCCGVAVTHQIDVGLFDPDDTTPDPTPPSDPDLEIDPMGIKAIYSPTKDLVDTGHDMSFALLATGDVRHATGPDLDYNEVVGGPTLMIRGVEHYNQCLTLNDRWQSV